MQIDYFTLTFDRAPSWGWLAPGTIVAFVASIAVLSAFVVVEKKVRWPLVDLSLFRNARFTSLVVAGTIANIAYAVTIYLSTLNLQEVRGFDPLMAGLAFLGPSVGAALGGRCRAGWPRQVPAGARHGIRLFGCCSVAGCPGGFGRLGSLPIRLDRMWFHGVRPMRARRYGPGVRVHHRRNPGRRAARARGRGSRCGTESLVMLAGVGLAVSGTMLEVLRRTGIPTGGGIEVIFLAIAATLLPAESPCW